MLSWWSHWRAKDAYTRASLCNTPVLTSFVLKVHYVYIVINHGVELKEKAPPTIWLFYVSTIEIVVDGMSCYLAQYNFGIM